MDVTNLTLLDPDPAGSLQWGGIRFGHLDRAVGGDVAVDS
jgi:hypothetical protein